MSGQVQELQVPGTPEGVPWLGYLPVHCPSLGSTSVTRKKNSARTGMGPKNDPCLAPDDPRNLWQIFNKIEQTGKKRW